jgi:SMODS and SLOG-associating 2TM effector domain 2
MESPKPTDNLQAMKLPVVGQPEQDQELQQLYAAVVAKTEEAIRWYDRHKSLHKRRAVLLRGSAVVFAGLASIVPIAVSMFPPEWNPQRWVPVASILAGIGAGCIGFDRLYGFSFNWMRYLTALLDLQAQLELLQFSWTRRALESRLSGGPKSDNLTASLNLLQTALTAVNHALKTETLEWVTHFSGALQDFEKSLAAQRAAAPTSVVQVAATHGALKVQIAGLDSLDGRQCKLQLGETGPVIEHTGTTKAFTGLTPGQHLLRVTATLQGRPVSTEDIVTIKPGETTSVTVTLG